MAGTLIAYQGHRCQAVTFNRSRGYASDRSEVVLLAKSFPSAFRLRLPPPGGLHQLEDMQVPDLSAIRSGRAAPLDFKSELRWAGTLVMAEAQDTTWQVVAHPMFVLGLELAKASEGGVALVRVILGDVRHLYAGRGFLRRWSYNRVRGDGTLAADSLDGEGAPVQRAAIAKDVVQALPGAPDLSGYPPRWDEDGRQVDFSPDSPAVLALGELVREGGLVDPCLRLDGTLALHRRGDGRLGWAPGGVGRNVRDLPADLRLWKDGRGVGHQVELTYRDEYVIVSGGLTIKTVQVDNAEPVLVQHGIVRVLNEDLAKELTGGAWTWDRLRKFVLLPPTHQHDPGIKPEVLRLFREQAFRLWRVAGAEVEKPITATLGEVREHGIDLERKDTVAAPGPNAHLLPLMARAETTGGRRGQVTVEAHGYEAARRDLFGHDQASQDAAQARQRLAEIRERIQFVGVRTEVNPFLKPRRSRGVVETATDVAEVVSPAAIRSLIRALREDSQGAPSEMQAALLDGGEIGWLEFGGMIDEVYLVERIASVDAGLGKQYEQESGRLRSALDEQNGSVLGDLYALAKKARGYAKELGGEDGAGFLLAIQTSLKKGGDAAKIAERFLEEIHEALVALGKKQVAQQSDDGTRTRRAALAAKRARTIHRNHDRRQVPATVFSAELGIVKTARLAGHLEHDGVLDPSTTRLVPMPVRITFGAHVRPRLDESPGGSTTTRTRQESEDQASRFVRAYKRGVREVEINERKESRETAVEIGLDAIPAGEGRVVVRRDMVELVPLEATGNADALEQAAEAIAADLLDAPEKIESATYVMARPWPINCDGVVAGVTIRSRSQPAPGTGFETLVRVGSGAAPLSGLGRTRERPPVARGQNDAATREGLS